MFSIPTSTIFCFLFLLILVITVEPVQRHRSIAHRRGTNTAYANFTTCLHGARRNGDTCRTFQFCCIQNCQWSRASAKCTMTSGRVNGYCICGGASVSARCSRSDADTDADGDNIVTHHGGIIIIDDGTLIILPPSHSHEGEEGGDNWFPTPRPSGILPPLNSNEGEEGPSVQCGRPSIHATIPKFRVVNGSEASPHSLPWQAILRFDGDYRCGASLLDDTHAITAAHCFKGNSDPWRYKVVFGLHDRFSFDSSARSFDVDRIIVPRYNIITRSEDIAILELASPVQFTTAIQPICLPENDAQIGKECIVSGWGHQQEGGNLTRYLFQVTVPIVSSTICNNTHHYRSQIDGTMLCAGTVGKDSCDGDSGGPLVCQRSDGVWELQGIASWGTGCGRKYKPGVFTRVYAMKSWIEENMN